MPPRRARRVAPPPPPIEAITERCLEGGHAYYLVRRAGQTKPTWLHEPTGEDRTAIAAFEAQQATLIAQFQLQHTRRIREGIRQLQERTQPDWHVPPAKADDDPSAAAAAAAADQAAVNPVDSKAFVRVARHSPERKSADEASSQREARAHEDAAEAAPIDVAASADVAVAAAAAAPPPPTAIVQTKLEHTRSEDRSMDTTHDAQYPSGQLSQRREDREERKESVRPAHYQPAAAAASPSRSPSPQPLSLPLQLDHLNSVAPSPMDLDEVGDMDEDEDDQAHLSQPPDSFTSASAVAPAPAHVDVTDDPMADLPPLEFAPPLTLHEVRSLPQPSLVNSAVVIDDALSVPPASAAAAAHASVAPAARAASVPTHAAAASSSSSSSSAACCSICASSEPPPWSESPLSSSDARALLACHKCGVGVHAACYGVTVLPLEDSFWWCAVCDPSGLQRHEVPGGLGERENTAREAERRRAKKAGPEAYLLWKTQVNPDQKTCFDARHIRCCVCTQPGGAFLPLLVEFNYCHVLCARFLPPGKLDEWPTPPYRYFSLAPFSSNDVRSAHTPLVVCQICKAERWSYCTHCSAPGCLARFHTSCAQKRGWKLVGEPEAKADSVGGAAASASASYHFRAYCRHHSNLGPRRASSLAAADDEGEGVEKNEGASSETEDEDEAGADAKASGTDSDAPLVRKSKKKRKRARRAIQSDADEDEEGTTPAKPAKLAKAAKAAAAAESDSDADASDSASRKRRASASSQSSKRQKTESGARKRRHVSVSSGSDSDSGSGSDSDASSEFSGSDTESGSSGSEDSGNSDSDFGLSTDRSHSSDEESAADDDKEGGGAARPGKPMSKARRAAVSEAQAETRRLNAGYALARQRGLTPENFPGAERFVATKKANRQRLVRERRAAFREHMQGLLREIPAYDARRKNANIDLLESMRRADTLATRLAVLQRIFGSPPSAGDNSSSSYIGLDALDLESFMRFVQAEPSDSENVLNAFDMFLSWVSNDPHFQSTRVTPPAAAAAGAAGDATAASASVSASSSEEDESARLYKSLVLTLFSGLLRSFQLWTASSLPRKRKSILGLQSSQHSPFFQKQRKVVMQLAAALPSRDSILSAVANRFVFHADETLAKLAKKLVARMAQGDVDKVKFPPAPAAASSAAAAAAASSSSSGKAAKKESKPSAAASSAASGIDNKITHSQAKKEAKWERRRATILSRRAQRVAQMPPEQAMAELARCAKQDARAEKKHRRNATATDEERREASRKASLKANKYKKKKLERKMNAAATAAASLAPASSSAQAASASQTSDAAVGLSQSARKQMRTEKLAAEGAVLPSGRPVTRPSSAVPAAAATSSSAAAAAPVKAASSRPMSAVAMAYPRDFAGPSSFVPPAQTDHAPLSRAQAVGLAPIARPAAFGPPGVSSLGARPLVRSEYVGMGQRNAPSFFDVRHQQLQQQQQQQPSQAPARPVRSLSPQPRASPPQPSPPPLQSPQPQPGAHRMQLSAAVASTLGGSAALRPLSLLHRPLPPAATLGAQPPPPLSAPRLGTAGMSLFDDELPPLE